MKTHFAVKPPFDTTEVSSCGRGKVITNNVRHVTCGHCQKTDAFILAKDEDSMRRHDAFMAQTPRKMTEPWHKDRKPMVCKECGNDTFREGDRTCYGHYANFHCSMCGHVESRLTETGMSA